MAAFNTHGRGSTFRIFHIHCLKKLFYFLYLQELIKTEKGEKIAKNIGAVTYVECSAKTQENVQKVFEIASREAIKHKANRKKDRPFCTII